MTRTISTLALIGSLILASCAAYSRVGGRHVSSAEGFAIDVPEGWWQHNLANDQLSEFIQMLEKRRKLAGDALRLTRDGLLLQQIAIGRMPIANELPHTKKKLTSKMIPLEAADVLGDNLRSNSELNNQEILENAPAKTGGYPGFKLHYTYRTENELQLEGLFYGTIVGPWLYYIVYEAPSQHYFAKDFQLFEKIRSSFEILQAP